MFECDTSMCWFDVFVPWEMYLWGREGQLQVLLESLSVVMIVLYYDGVDWGS